MVAKPLNGTYYEFCGGMTEDELVKLGESDMTDREAKDKAINEERCVYKNTYEQGKRIASVEIWDPYHDACFHVSGDRFYNDDRLYYEPLPHELSFRYQMLGRLRMDCEYFLGNGNGYEGHLWAGSVEDQIKEMKRRWNEFEEDEKPEWLTMEDINRYEKEMLEKKKLRALDIYPEMLADNYALCEEILKDYGYTENDFFTFLDQDLIEFELNNLSNRLVGIMFKVCADLIRQKDPKADVKYYINGSFDTHFYINREVQ